MKTLLFSMILAPLGCLAQSSEDIIRYERLLKQEKYEDLFEECEASLKKPYGKTSHLATFYLAQSLCGAGYKKNGKEWLSYIKRKLPIDKSFAKEVDLASVNCGIRPEVSNNNKVTVVINRSLSPTGRSGVSGKGAFKINCDKEIVENYDKLRSNDSLSRRIFMPHQKKEALISLRSYLPEAQYNIDTSGRFIIVSDNVSNLYLKDLLNVTEKLEFAYQFFIKKYGITPIDKLFTVYLVGNRYSLGEVAFKVHDIKISKGNMGYSSLNDLSLFGIAQPGQVGTLFHELFHLMIRSDIGDISPWLDEGMACLYSVYDTKGEILRGSENTWRVLHFKLLVGLNSKTYVKMPSLEQLLNYNWEEYQGGEEKRFCQASVNYALSNLFLLYLQHEELENEVIKTFKNRRSLASNPRSPGPDDIGLIEHIFKKDIYAVSQDFYSWLNERYNINVPELLKSRPTYTSSGLPDNFQSLEDSLHLQLTQIKGKVRRSTFKKLRNETDHLFYEVSVTCFNFDLSQRRILGDLWDDSQTASNEDSPHSRLKDGSEDNRRLEDHHNGFLKTKESDALKLISRLKKMIADYQRTERKI